MNLIKIENFNQLNELVAKELGYVKYTWIDECSQFTPGAEWNYGEEYYEQTYTAWIPEEVYKRTQEEWEANYNNTNSNYYDYSSLEEYIDDKWLYTIPKFNSDYKAIEIIVEYLIDKSLAVELYKNKDYSVATIYTDPKDYLISVQCGRYSSSITYKLNSLPLAICLAFLEYKNIEVELTNEFK